MELLLLGSDDTWGDFGVPEAWPACITLVLSVLPQAIYCAGCGEFCANKP